MDKADINISTNSIVSIIIAIVLIGMVFIPIVNSLGDGNGSGGNGSGGDEGSSESQKTVINSFEDLVGLTSTTYKSYDVYFPSETPTLPHEISYTLDDILDMAETFTPTGDIENIYSVLITASGDEDGVSVYFEGEKIYISIHPMDVEIDAVESFTVNIATDYTVSYSLKPSDSDEVQNNQFTATEIDLLSESEYGWILNDLSVSQPYIANGCGLYIGAYLDRFTAKIVVLTQDMFSDNQLQFTVDWGEGYHSDVVMPIQSTATDGVWQIAWDEDNYVPITVKDSSGTEVENSEVYFGGITTYGYVSSDNTESPDSGSGSGSGSNGMTSTIISIIPVFAVLGLLIFILNRLGIIDALTKSE